MTQIAPLLEVKDLVKYYPITKGFFRKSFGIVKAVDGVSFHINTRENLALVGESGCGKTTTGRCILRALHANSGQILFRENASGPVDLLSANSNQLKHIRQKIRMVFQDPFSSLNPRMTIMQIIGEPLMINGVVRGKKEMEEHVAELLRMVRLDPAYINRYPHAFSGGQRQRIAIARALALEPTLIIADEPVSALDVSVQAQILNLFEELQSRLGTTYLFIAHNLSVVKHISNRVAVMYLGKIVEQAETEELFTNPKHPYSEALMAAAPNADPRFRTKKRIVLGGDVADPSNPPSGCAFHPRCRYAQEICKRDYPQFKLVARGANSNHFSACHFAEELQLVGVKDLI